jgi:glycine/D-amino acid oxidase-like deaminating enzyme
MPDELLVIGESSICPGQFVGAVLSGNGFAMDSVVGKKLSNLNTQGSSKHDLSAFSNTRF